MTAATQDLVFSLPEDYTRNSGERLGFTFFVSAILHLVVILGVGFTIIKKHAETPPMLEVTLAQHSSPEAPADADFLAQYNQKASGTESERQALTTDRRADFASAEINPVEPLPQMQTTAPDFLPDHQLITSTSGDAAPSPIRPQERHPEETTTIQDKEITTVTVSEKLASLQAKLDRQRQEQARQARVRTLTSLATRSSVDAEYLFNWQERVEMIGNLNYPDEARQKQMYGHLRMLVTVLPSGNVEKVELLKSSGHVLLDQSALRIVRMAAPYPPFPEELRRQVDRLEIIRTWRFEKGDVFSSEAE